MAIIKDSIFVKSYYSVKKALFMSTKFRCLLISWKTNLLSLFTYPICFKCREIVVVVTTNIWNIFLTNLFKMYSTACNFSLLRLHVRSLSSSPSISHISGKTNVLTDNFWVHLPMLYCYWQNFKLMKHKEVKIVFSMFIIESLLCFIKNFYLNINYKFLIENTLIIIRARISRPIKKLTKILLVAHWWFIYSIKLYSTSYRA